jgi:hypothetical protein
MRIFSAVSAAIIASVGFIGSASAADAVPMAASELEAVKGEHVHFVSPSQNTQNFGVPGLQLAGDVKTENNWSNEWGGSDGMPVAPSYKGLCVATGLSGTGNSVLFIPGGEMQCPL